MKVVKKAVKSLLMSVKVIFVALACDLSFVGSILAADFPEGSPKFETSLSAALSLAKEVNKPLAVVFSAAWCGPCVSMKKQVYPSALVRPFHDKFIWAYLDIDERSNAGDAKKYKVVSIPHIEFLNADGTSISKQLGAVSEARFAKILAGVFNPKELDASAYVERGQRKYALKDYAGAI